MVHSFPIRQRERQVLNSAGSYLLMSLESVTITFTGTSEKLKALDAVAESKQWSRDNF
jgi:hypothetical protein